MPLPIRDGNQSLTTLSTLLVGNAHIPAHTVVSLGSQAITDIAGAVSGVELGPNTINALENIQVSISAGSSITIGNVVSVTGGLTNAELRASSVTIGGSVSVSNLPATQTVTFGQASVTFGQASVTFGTSTITGSVSVLNFPTTQTVTFTQASVTFGQAIVSAANINPLLQSVGTDNTADANLQFMKIGGHQDGQNQTSHIVHVSSGGAMKVDATDSSITFGAITGSVSVLNLPATQTVTFTAITGATSVLNFPATQAVTFGQASVTFSSVTISNFPATQAVTFGQAGVTFGTAVVTGSVSVLNLPSTQTVTFSQASITFGAITGSVSILNFPASQSVTFTQASVTFSSVSISNFPSTQTIAGTVTATVREGEDAIINDSASGYTTIRAQSHWFSDSANEVKATSDNNPLPISGTVTANGPTPITAGYGWDSSFSGFPILFPTGNYAEAGFETLGSFFNNLNEQDDGVPIKGNVLNPIPVSGTVTANVSNITDFATEIGINAQPNSGVQLGFYSESLIEYRAVSEVNGLPISGTVTANVPFASTTATFPNQIVAIGYRDGLDGNTIKEVNNDSGELPVKIQRIDAAGALNSQFASWIVDGGGDVPISGTVTASAPNGSLTTRFGTPVTANTAFATSAVTNTSRKYLLIQNVTTGSNVITVGIGFTPTTTQGIQLTAGAGITFESSYIPTGAVYVLSSVTASNFTILEA